MLNWVIKFSYFLSECISFGSFSKKYYYYINLTLADDAFSNYNIRELLKKSITLEGKTNTSFASWYVKLDATANS